MHWSDIWEGQSIGAKLSRTALTPLSWLYSLGWRSYRTIYRLGLKKTIHPHRPIVCVGSLQVGGSGKSPVTLFLADQLRAMGRQVVIGCSGYGSSASKEARIAPAGPLDASTWGDEPAMIRWLLPDVPLVVGRRRVLAAELCRRNYPDAVLVMDDGFQHLPLQKDFSILLQSPGRNQRCLPAGPFREPPAFAKLADLVIPGEFQVITAPLEFVLPDGELLKKQDSAVSALCALARPDQFFQGLKDAGLRLDATLSLSDHDPLNRGNLFGTWPKERPIVVTAKDWVKIRERNDVGGRTFWIARRQVTIEPRDAFCERLQQSLDEKKERL